MRKLILYQIFLMLVFSSNINAQSVKRLNDPSIVAQHKRMTYERWGDWRPYPRRFLGIQTNFAYATVWGMWAPKRNKQYKKGEDIRPLKIDGLQNKRLLELKFQEEEAERIHASADTVYKRSVQDFAHWTSAIVDADPLWLLYYKRMLNPVRVFPANPSNYVEWTIKDQETFDFMKKTGKIAILQEELDLIKEKNNLSRTMDMPRGKRFLMYHETLIRWRAFEKSLRAINDKTTLLLTYKNIIKDRYNFNQSTPKSDKQIVEEVMEKYKNKY
ncbi:hypothetical protein [Vaginella massiliensis]|uniref:hypothetical protein n=1 Tax=Vaginella massiliensis TaxID=1816680 RepID=UPI000837AE43|nr:hypothetical protein [Vaginella massiliensis]